MIISLIVAMDEQRGIGRGNALPWRLSDDLKRFKALTRGHFLVLGRKTYEAIGCPLPDRNIIIMTRRQNYTVDGCWVADSLQKALKIAQEHQENEIFIGGGGDIFSQALPLADRIYLTQVHASLGCDVFFPELVMVKWVEQERSFHAVNERNQYPSTFLLLTRRC